MIPSTLRIVLLVAVFLYYIIILLLLKNKTLELRYTLLWMFCGLVLAVLIVCPEILAFLVRLVGVQSNMNGLFLMGFAFLIMIIMSLTAIVSKQTNKIRILVQEMAILEKRVRELEKEKVESSQG